jgi:hydrogenase small subunit
MTLSRCARGEMPVSLTEQSLATLLASRGLTRRDFLKFSVLMAGTLALPRRYTGRIMRAVENPARPTLVWLELQDCAGCSESILRASQPDVAQVVLETFSWEYHELIMAGAGHQAEDALARVVREERGQYIAIVEGAIPVTDDGVYCTIGGRTALDIVREVTSGAAAAIAVGACAWDGGFVAGGPTGAVGLQHVMPDIPIVNLAGCPPNAAVMTATLVHYLTFGEMPETDSLGRPLFAYGSLIHDECPRRPHYNQGRFVREWGDEGHRQGWCLYQMGCKGPVTSYSCPTTKWNDGTSWPVQAGHGCIGCATPSFWFTVSPFYDPVPGAGRRRDVPPTPSPLPPSAQVPSPAPTPAATHTSAVVPATATTEPPPELTPTRPLPATPTSDGPPASTTTSTATPTESPPPDDTDDGGDIDTLVIIGGGLAAGAAVATGVAVARRLRSSASRTDASDDTTAEPVDTEGDQ